MTKDQENFMREAIRLSIDNVDNGGGPFGAVIVKDGEIIAKAANSVANDNDPTAHAEVNAIRQAAKKLNDFDLSGCEIYSSCEPCPMCLAAIYWAHIDKLYFANTKTDADQIGFSDNFIYEELGLDYDLRKIQTQQILKEEAMEAFKKWDELEGKIEY